MVTETSAGRSLTFSNVGVPRAAGLRGGFDTGTVGGCFRGPAGRARCAAQWQARAARAAAAAHEHAHERDDGGRPAPAQAPEGPEQLRPHPS
eukprot:2713552-Prymnesium_polylepis.1